MFKALLGVRKAVAMRLIISNLDSPLHLAIIVAELYTALRDVPNLLFNFCQPISECDAR